MRKTLLAIAIATIACSKSDAPARDSSAATSTAPSSPQTAAIVRSQIVPSDPCGWISQAEAEKVLGEPLSVAPVRVRSAESPDSSSQGAACRYDLKSSGPLERIVAVELSPDESGVMQAAFMGMGNVEAGLGGTEAKGDTLIAGRWDFVSEVPGGLTAAKKGRISVLIFAPVGSSEKGLALAGAMVDRIPDLPFTNDAADPKVAPQGNDPCALLTRAEAEAVLGPLVVAPYRSRKRTALVYGSGPSCSYYSGKHRALVVTPTWRLGAEMFRMIGGVSSTVAGKVGGTAAPDTLEGNWDQLATGTDGTLHVLKGDRMLSLQFKSSGASYEQTVSLVRSALARF